MECVNFEGVLGCALLPSNLNICSLNPSTFEGVECEGGTCWFVAFSFH
jgi:hypothetical protein